MNTYELAIVFRANLDEETLKAEFDKVSELIARFGGTIDKVDEWGKRRLAYEIDKQTEGVYYFITFNSNPDTPSEVENRIRILENVLRFLIIRQDD